MPIKRSLLKREARQEMAGARPNAMLMTLLYVLLTTGVSTVIGQFVDNPVVRMQALVAEGMDPDRAIMLALSGVGFVALFLTLLVGIYSLVVGYGYTGWSLKASRGINGEFSDLVSGFSMAGRVLLLQLVLAVYCLLWGLVFLIPASILAVLTGAFPALSSLIMLAASVLYSMRILRYSMAVLCLIDNPDGGVMQAIRRSRDMMEGNCAGFLGLILSFIGWYLILFLLLSAAQVAVTVILGGPELIAAVMARDITAAAEIIAVAAGSTPAAVAVYLVSLPLQLWLTPYVTITHARYYDLLQTRQLGVDYTV